MEEVRSVDDPSGHGVADLRGFRAGFHDDVGDAVAVEIGAAYDKITAAVGEGAALVVETEADFDVGRQVLGCDGEADHFGAIGADHDGLGIGGFTGAGE